MDVILWSAYDVSAGYERCSGGGEPASQRRFSGKIGLDYGYTRGLGGDRGTCADGFRAKLYPAGCWCALR